MRLPLRFLALLTPILVTVVVAFLLALQSLERTWVTLDLENRARLVSESTQDSIISSVQSGRGTILEKLLNRVSTDSRVLGLVVCSEEGKLINRSSAAPRGFECQSAATLAGEPPQILRQDSGGEVHRAIFPLAEQDEEGGVRKFGYLAVFHDPSYMAQRGQVTRIYALAAFLTLGFIIALVTILVYRWSFSQPLQQLSQTIKSILTADISKIRLLKGFEKTELAPLVKDIDKVILELRRRQLQSSGAAPGSAFTPQRLREEVQRLFGDSRVCVIANREPYIHNRKGKSIEVQFPASGLVSAVEPIVRACSGLWIGHGSGTADRETADKNGIVLVPPGKAEYALKRVWLTREEEQGYYYGFSNEGLWPLCHIAHTRPMFRAEDWQHYQSVNRKFAEAFESEMKSKRPIALIQDYHFAILPGMIRERRPDAITSLFWHIPWPNFEAIGICPWKIELLQGMLGANLIGFHTQYHCNNFLDTVDRYLEARVDRSNFSVTIKGHTCFVKPFPISVEWPPRHEATPADIQEIRHQVVDELSIAPDSLIGIGIDRIDYTKGIIERLLGVEKMLDQHPELVGKFVFVQVGAPSRTHIKRYQDLNSEVQEVADRINWKFRRPGFESYVPVILKLSHHDAAQVFRYYRSADVCIVSSLHDGMNLVAKEYVAARTDEGGALVLSSFTGAARELTDAFIVNPYDVEETADGIYRALTISPIERQKRMARMRSTIAANNVYAWAAQFLQEIHQISESRRTGVAGGPR